MNPEPVKDLRLMAKIAEGDQSALGALYDCYAPKVFAVCLRILREPAEAEDALGDVFWEVWHRADRYRPERGTALAYLVTMARSRALDRLRSRDRRDRLKAELEEPAIAPVAAAPSTISADPHDGAIASERRVRVRTALGELSPEQRQALELSYYGGFSHSEIAQALGEPLGTVKTRIRQGLIHLRRSFRALYGSEESA